MYVAVVLIGGKILRGEPVQLDGRASCSSQAANTSHSFCCITSHSFTVTLTSLLFPGAYNVLMGVVLSEMSKGHGFSTLLQEGDATKWFDLAAWFTGYVRLQQVCV